MATKTWKLGEVCRGGIITVIASGTKVTVIGKDWDFSQGSRRGSNQANAKEWTRLETIGTDDRIRREIDNFLNDLTTSYHSGQILDWIKTKVEFTNSYW
jgi:hypothetical protein